MNRRKVLLIRFSSLGDVVLTSSLIEPLIRSGYGVDILTYRPYGGLFAEDERVSVLETSREEIRKNFKTLLDRLKSRNYFAVLDLHANLKGFLIRTFLPAPVKAVYKKRPLRRRLCVFLNRFGLAKGLKEKSFFVPDLYAETLKVLGINPGRVRPKIEINPEAFENTLKRFGLEKERYIAVGVGARYKKKEYPRFGEVAELLVKRGYRVAAVGGAEDFKKVPPLKGVLNLCGQLSLVESLHILKGATFFVGNDSGATHMARAVGTKVAVIYGGTHPCFGFAPYPDEGVVIFKNLPCSPCDLHGKGGCDKNFQCLDIEPSYVVEMVLKYLLPNGV
jgi:ADP-heptose:LPS heptosyltransferase